MTMKKPKGLGLRRKESAMLSLQLKDGEYLTIGEDIVIQVASTSAVKLLIKAPRDMTILRGEVREKNGEGRPECLIGEQPAKKKKAKNLPHNSSVSSG